MIKTVNECSFIDSFRNSGVYKDNFSYEGLQALFEFYEGCEDASNPMELDVVAICCYFSEYDSLESYNKDSWANEEDHLTLDELRDHTIVLQLEGDGLIIGSY